MDISIPKLNGIQILKKFQAENRNVPVVILSMHEDLGLVRQALRYGARGYLLKRSITDELLLAIRAAIKRETYVSSILSGELFQELMTHAADEEDDILSPREIEVLHLIAEGYTNAEIGQILNISVKTVEKHRSNLMEKLGIHDMAGLIKEAIRRKLIFLDDQP